MKDKTKQSKEYLIAAINALPDDFSLAEARRLLRSALVQIEHSENKRHNRLATQKRIEEEFKNKISQAASKNINPKQSLSMIEKMIDEEKVKMQKSTPIQNLHD